MARHKRGVLDFPALVYAPTEKRLFRTLVEQRSLRIRSRLEQEAARVRLRHSHRERGLGLYSRRYLRNRTSRAARVAGNNAAIFHFVDPITGFGNSRIVGGQEQRFFALLHDILK